MGVHVTLTGIRGATAPFLGMFLYVGWDLGWFSFDGMHEGLFLLAAGLSAISWAGFRRLHRDMRRSAA